MSRTLPPDLPPARHARQRPPARAPRRVEPHAEAVVEEGEPLGPSLLRRASRAAGVAGGGVALLGAVAIGLFPTQTFLEQRADTREAQERLYVLEAQNEAFEDRIERLQTDEEIERLAREQYNLVYPGEEAYAVLPAPLPPVSLPSVWPFGPMLDRRVTADEVDDQLATP